MWNTAYGLYGREAAHRVAFKIATGVIGEDLMIDHKCENPICVNPAHLDAVTGGDNQRRRRQRSKRYFTGAGLFTDDGCIRLLHGRGFWPDPSITAGATAIPMPAIQALTV